MTGSPGPGSRGRPRDPPRGRGDPARRVGAVHRPRPGRHQHRAGRQACRCRPADRVPALVEQAALLIAALDRARGVEETSLYQPLLDTEAELTEPELHAAVAQLLESMIEIVCRTELRALITRLIGAASSHPALVRTFWDNYLHPHRQRTQAAIRRAVELGGLPADTDPELLMDAVVGTALFPTLLHPDLPNGRELRARVHVVLVRLGITTMEPDRPPAKRGKRSGPAAGGTSSGMSQS